MMKSRLFVVTVLLLLLLFNPLLLLRKAHTHIFLACAIPLYLLCLSLLWIFGALRGQISFFTSYTLAKQ